MSRKWERTIERNQKQMERIRKNDIKGKGSKQGARTVFKGRRIILPVIFLLLSFFFMFILDALGDRDAFYWVAIGSYWLLALYFFFKRPYLAVGPSDLSTQRLNREVTLKPSEVEEITLADDSIVIVIKEKQHRWVFTRIPSLFPIKDMSAALMNFAVKHAVRVNDHRGERK